MNYVTHSANVEEGTKHQDTSPSRDSLVDVEGGSSFKKVWTKVLPDFMVWGILNMSIKFLSFCPLMFSILIYVSLGFQTQSYGTLPLYQLSPSYQLQTSYLERRTLYPHFTGENSDKLEKLLSGVAQLLYQNSLT